MPAAVGQAAFDRGELIDAKSMLVLLLVTYIPALSLWLPKLFR